MARKSWITGFLWMVVAVLAAGFTSAPKAAKTAKPAQQQAITISPVQNTTTHVYGAFWQVGPGYSTTLILKNKDRQKPLAVNLVLFSSSGQMEKTAPVQLGPNATKRVELSSLIKPADDVIHGGGLALEFDAGATGLIGQAVINNTANGSSVSLPLGGGYQWDNENALQAPWWLADGSSQASLRLFNSSSQAIVVTPSVTVEGAEQTGPAIGLAAHESKQVSLRDLLAQSKTKSADLGAVTLRYNGLGHALQPALLLGNNSGLWLAPGFQARHSAVVAGPPPVPRIRPGPLVSPVADQADLGATSEALLSRSNVAVPRPTLPRTGTDPAATAPADPQAPAAAQTRWQFPEVKLQWAGSKDPLRAYALLTNGTNAPMAVSLNAYFPAVKIKAIMQQAQLPVPDLAPQETRLVDLSQFVENGTIPGKPAHVALVAGHTGVPGDLGITVFSVTPGWNQAFTAAGAILPAAVTDVSYWQIRGKIGSPRNVRNADDTQVQAQMVLYYPSPLGVGSYTLPVMTLAGHQEKTARMGHVARIPDERGAMAPVETRAGLVAVVAMAPGNNQPPLVDQTATCDRECGLITPSASKIVGGKTISGTGVTDSTAPGGAVANDLIIIITYHYHVYFTQNFNIHFNQECFPPEVDEITPSSAKAGQTVDVTITGDFFPEDASLSVSGGINVLSYSVDSETEISATFEIPYDPSAVGAQTVTVGGQYGEGSGIFTVNPPGRPGIEIMTPDHGTAGTTVQVHIDGGNFRQGDTISVEGISASMVVVDDENINATFQIPANAAPGDHNVLLTDPVFGGQSNPTPFTVTVPAPVINSVTPSPWQAGTSILVTIQGSGFGTDPFLDITDPAGLVTLVGWQGSPTMIQANVIVDGSAPAENATITVTASNGGEFARARTTTSSLSRLRPAGPVPNFAPPPLLTATAQVPVQPITLPTPKILLFGSDITGTTVNVAVGQQIALTSSIPSTNPPVQVSSQSWVDGDNPNSGALPGTVIGSLTLGTNSHGDQPQAVQSLTGAGVTFYWVSLGTSASATYRIRYTYCVGTCSANTSRSATATFTVVAPTRPQTPVAIETQHVSIYVRPLISPPVATMKYQDVPIAPGTGKPGIRFQAQFTLPQSNQGSYQWVQLQNMDEINFISRPSSATDARGVGKCTSFSGTPGTSNQPNANSELDGTYPYGISDPGTILTTNVTDDTAADSPAQSLGTPLVTDFGEMQRQFSATMYLRWVPAKDSRCNASTGCTIPVSLGSMTWGYSACAINTLQDQSATDPTNKTGWVFGGVGCPNNTTQNNVTFTPSDVTAAKNFGYPTWQNTVPAHTTVCNRM